MRKDDIDDSEGLVPDHEPKDIGTDYEFDPTDIPDLSDDEGFVEYPDDEDEDDEDN